MIVIKKFLKYVDRNVLEVTWIDEIKSIIEVEVQKVIDNEIVFVQEKQEVVEEIFIQCSSYSDCQIDLLTADALKYGTSLDDYETIIKEVVSNIVLPTQAELDEIAIENEKKRISLIKRKSGDIIESKYPLYKQLNITNLLDGYTNDDKTKMIDFINSIRVISNKAELDGTALEDIDWGIK